VFAQANKFKRCLELCHHLHTHEKLGIIDGQRRCTKSKHKEAWALKEREELVVIVGGALQKSAFELVNRKREKTKGKGF
jgi:hypothetical protein